MNYYLIYFSKLAQVLLTNSISPLSQHYQHAKSQHYQHAKQRSYHKKGIRSKIKSLKSSGWTILFRIKFIKQYIIHDIFFLSSSHHNVICHLSHPPFCLHIFHTSTRPLYLSCEPSSFSGKFMKGERGHYSHRDNGG